MVSIERFCYIWSTSRLKEVKRWCEQRQLPRRGILFKNHLSSKQIKTKRVNNQQSIEAVLRYQWPHIIRNLTLFSDHRWVFQRRRGIKARDRPENRSCDFLFINKCLSEASIVHCYTKHQSSKMKWTKDKMASKDGHPRWASDARCKVRVEQLKWNLKVMTLYNSPYNVVFDSIYYI